MKRPLSEISKGQAIQQMKRLAPIGIVLTPARAVFVLAFWLLGPLANLLSVKYRSEAYLVIYAAYFLTAIMVLAVEYWPRSNPAAEGLRRAYRLLPVDPGMALVRGRGALEHALRQAAADMSITVHASDGPASIHDLLNAMRDRMPADLYKVADQLRRLANEAAHDPDWSTDRATARTALRAATQMLRWSRKARRR